MAHYRTVIEVEVPIVDEFGQYIDTEGEPVNDPVMRTEKYTLLHWGLFTSIDYDRENNPIPINETRAICQHMESGYIVTFNPMATPMRTIGREGV